MTGQRRRKLSGTQSSHAEEHRDCNRHARNNAGVERCLLPFPTISAGYKTIPVAIQCLRGGYGFVDMGAMMAMLVLAMITVFASILFAKSTS